MSAFAPMVDACFQSMGIDAIYQPNSGAPSFPVRVIVRQLDSTTHIGVSRIIASTAALDVRTKDVPKPQVGDRIVIDGATSYSVASEPLRDSERLVWTLSTSPPALWDPSAGMAAGPLDGGGF